MSHARGKGDRAVRIVPGGPIIRGSRTGCDRRDAFFDADLRACPLYEPDDKHAEAQYFLVGMMQEYHNPEQFRWNLNAFLQALRNVTFYIQKELTDSEGFKDWWKTQQDSMRSDPQLRAFVEGRNVVVKQRNLLMESRASIGIFRGHRAKMAMSFPVGVEFSSRVLLRMTTPDLKWLDDERSSIGEEYGVERDWFVPELGEGNALDLCDDAWHKISAVLDNAHTFSCIPPSGPELPRHRSAHCSVLTETDVDPSLPKKWGWD